MPDTGRALNISEQAAMVREDDDLAHTFRCVVCRKEGTCDGDCDRDPAAHVHFAEACWQQFRG